MAALFRLTVFLSLIFALVKAQVGPVIHSPENNTAVATGKYLKIEYAYPNLGPGIYTVDINLWKDATATEPIQKARRWLLPEPPSAGVDIPFSIHTTISVDIPSNLTGTFYLTLDQHVQVQNDILPTMSSAPLELYTAAMAHLPQSLSDLLVIALRAFNFSLIM